MTESVERAVAALQQLGICCYPHRRDGERVWSFGRPDAAYQVTDAGLVEHARVALRQAGRVPQL